MIWDKRQINLWDVVGNMFKFFGHPLVEALAGPGRCRRDPAVKIRGEPEVEFSGIGFVWINVSFAAVFKVFINDGMKTLDGFRNCMTVKADDISGIDDPADENAVVQVRFNGGNISLICNGIHGMSPVRVNNSLMSFTAYRFSSFCGWGL